MAIKLELEKEELRKIKELLEAHAKMLNDFIEGDSPKDELIIPNLKQELAFVNNLKDYIKIGAFHTPNNQVALR